MKHEKSFVAIWVILIISFITSFVLWILLNNYSNIFGLSVAFFGISIIMLFERKKALTPIDGFSMGKSTLRRHFNRIGKLEEYQKIIDT